MQAREADTGSVVWVGDLGPRVTDAALRNAFSQFGDVADARLVHDVFTRRPTGCGWVRFREPERAAAVLQRCNVTALYIVAGSPRPVLVGLKLADVMLGCWEDELAAAAAKAGLPAAAGGAGRARYELVDVSAVKDKRERQTHAALRGALEQQHTDHDCFLEACAAEQSKLLKVHQDTVKAEKEKLKRMEDMTKLCPDLGMRRR